MAANQPQVYIFGWPSLVGGADTRLAHLLRLLHNHCAITVVPNMVSQLSEARWTLYLERMGIAYRQFEDLPTRLDGFALAMCNKEFLVQRVQSVRERGLTVIWSNEMMEHFEEELRAVAADMFDRILYVSAFQRDHLAPGYGNLPSHTVGNYIDPELFPFRERHNERFTIGRLSRPAFSKYSEDSPVFYECLDLPQCRFRVMAWNQCLSDKYSWHRFDDRWDLLEAEQETQIGFLHSLDLFVYSLGRDFKESWGRAPIEAMLTGCVPLVPSGHYFEHLIIHGQTGYICSDFADYQQFSHELYWNHALRNKIALAGRRHAVENLFDKDKHVEMWLDVFQ